MSKHLEIFGKGITVNPAEIAWNWLNQALSVQESTPAVTSLLSILDHLANRELVQAEDKLKLYLFDHPDCVYGRIAAAAVCLYLDEPQKAIEQAQSVYFRRPSNTMALFLLGYCHERLGRTAEAIEFYQDCIKFKSHLQLPRQRMAAIYLSTHRLDLAIEQYEQLVTEYPDDIESLVLCGYMHIAAANYTKAVDMFNNAILSHPDNFTEVRQDDEIESLARSGEYDQALERIQATIEQIGPTAELILRMADVCSLARRDAEAIACYEYAARLQPCSLEAAIKLGTHYLRSRKFSLAAEQFNRAADVNDEIVDAYLGLACAQHLQGDTSDALKTMSLASSIHQNSTLLYSESATLQFQSVIDERTAGQTPHEKMIVLMDDVVSAYRRQLKDCGNSRSDVLYKYAILMMVEGNLPEAIKSLEQTLAANAFHYRARNKLALCAFDNSEPQRAMEILTSPKPLQTSIYATYYRVSILYCNKKDFAKAIRSLNTAHAAQDADTSVLRADIETTLENLGMLDRTFTNWKRLEETSECLLAIKNEPHSAHNSHK